ncbi:MAG: molybdopterin-dependent oxidoreductase [Deltaproteobacteria bacterium]|nr:molybdopterin-dependent oxidoreductase [Deltaproteobacteria bacterium]
MLETISLRRISGSRKDYDQVIAACCQECTVGCGLMAYVKDERIVDIQGNVDHPVNRGRLCAKGLAFVQGLTSSDRITLPGTRNRLNAPFEAFDNWEKGIDLLAERLRRVKEQHGAESLLIGCDPEAGLDFYLGAKRFARLWGTPHVYHPWQEAAEAAFPAEQRHPTRGSARWSQSRCLMLIEADLAATHPVAFERVLEAQRGGTKIIAVDSRFTTTLSKADMAVLIEPKRGNDLGLALMKNLLAGPWISPAAKTKFKDFQVWLDSYAAWPTEGLEAVIGVPAEKIRTMAQMLGNRQPAVLITAKRLAFARHYGIWLTMAQVLGWQETTGGGWYPLESGIPPLDSTVGLEEVPPAVSGYDSLTFPYQPNLLGPDVLETLEIKALIGSGNCLDDFLSPLQKKANDLDLTVYFGSFPNRTRQAAHMVFPATVWAERDGISFSNDGAVQWSPRVVKPHDACRTGLGFWMRLAQRFGWGDYFPWKKANGLADQKAFYQWLFENSIQTGGLLMDQIAPDNPLVYWRRDAAGSAQPEATLLPAPQAAADPSSSGASSAFPLSFQVTRTMTRSGEASRWWPWTRELDDDLGILIHPRIAQALEVENGETILVASEDEIIEGPATISRLVPTRLVWSLQRLRADRVLVYRKGQGPEEARDRLKTIGL